MATMTINLSKEFLEKTREKAEKQAKTEFENMEGTEDMLLYKGLEMNVEEVEIKDDHIKVSIDCKLGYMSFEIPLDIEDMVDLVEIAVKRLNKFKNLLESLK